jgi:two-component system, OmpR family, phosphate regulon sensor histidine kinase PhoR
MMTASAADILRALPNPAILVDQSSNVIAFSVSAAQLFPLLRAGDPMAFVLRNPSVVDALANVLRGGDEQLVDLTTLLPEARRLTISIQPVGVNAGALLSIEDRSEADSLDRMRTDFVANASHELRTPLAALLGFIETLQGPARNDTPARERFLGIMAQQARRMTRLIEDLLSLSRVEMRQHQRPSDAMELRAAVAESLDALSHHANEAGVTISVDAPEQPMMIRADRDDVLRLVDNLVGNAIRYGASGGKVQLTLRRQDQDAALSVRDFGPGIQADHLPRLTERFYRVDIQQSRESGGTGLGLAIVKHILLRHRGRMEIESEPGMGSTFTAFLPLSDGLTPKNPG